MKTQIKTIIATSFAALVLTAGSVSAKAIETNPATASTHVTKELKAFKRVAVNGNVEVTFVQSNKEEITYADNSAGIAKVMQSGDLLTISAGDNGTAKLIVYVKNLFRIQGNDNAVIKTDGELNVTYLQIFLKDNAHANINTNSTGLYTVLDNDAALTLSGATQSHIFAANNRSTLSMIHFTAKNSTSETQASSASKDTLALAK